MQLQRSLVRFVTALTLIAALRLPSVDAQEPEKIEGFVATLIDSVDVPALETGLLEKVLVEEGDRVTRGQLIAQLNDEQVRLHADFAETEFAIAKKLTDNHVGDQLAKNDLDQQQQLGDQQQILREMAEKKAQNGFKIRSAERAASAAKNEMARATKARRQFSDSVSQSEIDGLRLAYEKALMDTAQADFERQMDALSAKSEGRATALHKLKIDQAGIRLRQATIQKDVTGMQTNLKKNQLSLAQLAIENHKVSSPIDGVVIQRYQQIGQWVSKGTPIARVVRLSRLRAEGYMPTSVATKLRDRLNVGLVVKGDESEPLNGTVTFVSPIINPVDGQMRVLIEFDNPDEKVSPGSPMKVIIE